MKIGMLGAGGMAQPMARCLLKAGHDVTVYNRTRSRAEELIPHGATVADSVKAACETDVVISMLADDRALGSMEEEIVETLPVASVHVSMSTVSISIVQRLTAAHQVIGSGFLSAPVFGRPDAAAAGNLSIITAGPEIFIDRLMPLFEAMGKKIFRISELPYQANVIKLCGNGMLLSAIEGLAETMALVRKHGMSPAQFLDVMTNTLLSAPFYKSYGTLMVEERYQPPGFFLALGHKDASLLVDAGASVDLAMPSIETIQKRIAEAAAAGYAEDDIAALAALAFHGPK